MGWTGQHINSSVEVVNNQGSCQERATNSLPSATPDVQDPGHVQTPPVHSNLRGRTKTAAQGRITRGQRMLSYHYYNWLRERSLEKLDQHRWASGIDMAYGDYYYLVWSNYFASALSAKASIISTHRATNPQEGGHF